MPRSTVEVGRAVPEDVDLLLTLVRQARDQDQQPSREESASYRARMRSALSRPDVSVYLARCGGDPVGVVVLRLGETVPLTGQEAVHVDQLYVDPRWRRRGVARQLLAVAANAAEHFGAGDIVCSTPPGARDAQRFLARLGFTPLAVQRVVPLATLRRRLAGEGVGRRRTGAELVLARRRRQAAQRPVTAAAG